MSNKVDERITRIRFDNDQFEKGVATSLQSIDRLKNKLESTESIRAFEGIQRSADKTDLSGIAKAVDTISDKFSILRGVAIGVLSDIVTKAISAGESMVKSLSVDNMIAGWQKYDQEVSAVQTIMVTLEDTPIEEIEKALEKVGWFSDETSYSYEQMVGSMAKFISSGVSLQDATDAVIGLANASAAAGVSTKKAEHIFYNFSQAMGAGFMGLADWRSVELQNMATPEFKRNIINTALALNKIVKVGDDLYATAENLNNPNNWFSSLSMRTSLSEKWLDADVMREVLKQYEGFTDQVYKIQHDPEYDFDQASEAMDFLEEMGLAIQDVSNKAFRAAQEAKTFAEAVDATKDAVSTKWKDTFTELFGNYEQAKVLWTDFSEALYDLFAASGDVRNEILKQWNDPLSFLLPDQRLREAFAFPELQEGRDILLEGLWNIWNSIINVINAIKAAWREVFPEMTAKRLYDLTKRFRDFTARILESTENLEGFQKFLTEVFSVFRGVLNIGKKFLSFARGLWPVLQKISRIAGVIFSQVWQFFKDAFAYINGSERLGNAVEKLVWFFKDAKDAILEFDESSLTLPTFKDFLDAIKRIKEEGLGFGDAIGRGFEWIRKKFEKFLPVDTISGITESLRNLDISSLDVYESVKPTLTNIANLFVNLWDIVTRAFAGVSSGISSITSWISNQFQKVSLKDILATTVMGAMSWLSIRLGIMVSRIGKTFEELSELIWSFSKLINSTAFKIRMDALKSLGTTILMFVSAMYIFANIKEDKVWAAVTAIAVFAAALLAINVVLAKVEAALGTNSGLGVAYTKGKGLTVNAGGFRRTGIIALVLGVIGMVGAVMMLTNFMKSNDLTSSDIRKVTWKIVEIAGVLTIASSLMKLSSKLNFKWFGQSKFSLDSFYPLSISLATLIMVNVMNKIDKMSLDHVGQVIFSLITIFGSMALFGAVLQNVTAGAGFGMLAITASIYLILLALDRIGKMNIDLGENGPVVAVIVGLLFVLSKIANLNTAVTLVQKGERLKRASVNMVGIIFGLIACVGAIYLLSKLSPREVIQGSIATMGLLVVLFAGLSWVVSSANGASQFAGKGILGISVLLLAVSILITVLTVAYSIDPKSVFFASLTVAAILGMISVMGLGLQKISQISGTLAGVAVILGIVGGLTAALYFMLKTDLKTGLMAVGSMTVIALSLGGMCRLIGGMGSLQTFKETAGKVAYVGVLLGILVIVVEILNKTIKENPAMLDAAIAMSLLALSLGVMIDMLAAIKTLTIKQAFAVVIAVFGVCASLFGLILALSKFVDGEKLYWLKEYDTQLLILAGIVIAVTGFATLIGQLGPNAAVGAFYGVAAIGTVVIMIAGLVGLLYWLYDIIFAKHPGNLDKFKDGLNELIEIFYLMGAVLGSGFYGFVAGAAPQAASSLSQFAENLIPFSNVLKEFPEDFADKAIGFGKAVSNLSWYTSLADAFGGFQGFGKQDSPMLKAVKTLREMAPDLKETGNILSGVDLSGFDGLEQAFLSMKSMGTTGLGIFSLGIKAGFDYLYDIIYFLVGFGSENLEKAKTNIPLIIDIIGPFQDLLGAFEKAQGLWPAITGTRSGGFNKALNAIKNVPKKLPIDDFANLDKTKLEDAKTNSETLAAVMDAYSDVSVKLSDSLFFWQWIASLRDTQFDKIITFANSIVGYGKVLAEPTNFKYVEGAVNVTNKIAEAFNNLVANDITEDLDNLAQSIVNLAKSGINDVQNFFTDEQSRVAMQSAVNNFVDSFKWILVSEYQSNRIGGYFQAVLNAAINSLNGYSSVFYNEGALLHDEFIRGIVGELKDAGKAGLKLAKSLTNGSISYLRENSPSKRFFDIAVNAGLGAVEGMEAMEPAAYGAGGKLAREMSRGMQKEFARTRVNPAIQRKQFGILGDNNAINAAVDMVVEKVEGAFGKVVKKDGSDADGKTIFDRFIGDPINNGIENLKNQFAELNPENLIGNYTEEFDKFINQFMPGSVESALASSVAGAEITKNMFSNMPWLNNMEEVVDEAFQPVVTESIIDQILGGENVFDYESYLDGFQSYYEDIYSQMSDNSIQSLFGGDQLPSSYDYQSLSRAATGGGTVAGYTAEDVRALTTEIHGLEDALYSLKETMKDQHMVHSGEIRVKYTNESDFIDRIQTTIITSLRREARG